MEKAKSAPRMEAFERALRRFVEGLAKPEDAIVRDACIQRFEFTFEMAWRALQEYALGEGVECTSPRDCFRVGFRMTLLKNDPGWLAMVEDRSRTPHTYDEESAQDIFRSLPGYVGLFTQLLERLQEGYRRRAAEGL